MTPVSLFASMIEIRHVLGRTAAMMSRTSTWAVSWDTLTNVTSGTEVLNTPIFYLLLSVILTLCCLQVLPALWFSWRCSAANLTESCSTFEVTMCGNTLFSFRCRWVSCATSQFLQKCSTAVWNTMLLAWKIISQTMKYRLIYMTEQTSIS